MNAAHAQAFVEIEGTRIAYREDGDASAPALVLVNSLGTDVRMWDPQIDALAERFRIVRYDCRGHGASDVTEAVTLERLGSDLVALLDALAIERTHACGLSLGGITALWVAVHHPERIERAVFANTAARLGTREHWEGRIATVRAGGMASLRETVVGRFLSTPFRTEHPDAARRIGDMVEATPPDGYVAACGALRDADLRDVVGGIRAPSLVITSEWDESTPPAQGAALHAAIRGSALAEIPRAAHLSNVERPETFTSLVTRFLGVP